MDLNEESLIDTVNKIMARFIMRFVKVLVVLIPYEVVVFILWQINLLSIRTFYYASMIGGFFIAFIIFFYLVSKAQKQSVIDE